MRELEPTEEQVRVAAEALLFKPTGDVHQMVRDAWAVIAPMVLEEAAKACEGLPGRMVLDGPLVAYNCARTIRALKGGGR